MFVGVAVGVASTMLIFSIIAIPLFTLARFAEPGAGLGRPVVRDGLLHVAVPVGIGLGALTTLLVASWYWRGGRLPSE